MKRLLREELIILAKKDPEAIVDFTILLQDRVQELEARISSLERNSRTSSKPPSSDKGNFANRPKPKSTRKKSGKKPGGQKGHRGSTLQKVANPDHLKHHDFAPDHTCRCGAEIPPVSGHKFDEFEARQVHDIPPIQMEVTEHRARKCQCPGCGRTHVASFPEGVTAPAQYGPNVQANALYLANYQLIPYQRLAEIFTEIFGCSLSQGTLANFIKKGGEKATVAMESIREALVKSPVAHADETSCTVEGNRHWLHVFCTDRLTCYHLDPKRGREAMERMGILPRFSNLLIHDALSSYFTYQNFLHGPCNAHHQRELIYLHEEQGQKWAGELIDLLLEAKDLAERECSREEGSRRIIGKKTLNRIIGAYHRILEEGYRVNPEPPPKPRGQKGRVKRGKALNLLDRLKKGWEEVLGYFFYPELYPYDNNQAERDVRMMKVREKISGTFRSEDHGGHFSALRGIISSARKQSLPILETIKRLLTDPHSLGQSLAQGA